MAEKNEYYSKMVRLMNELWEEIDSEELEDNLMNLPENLRSLLYSHPLVEAFDLLP